MNNKKVYNRSEARKRLPSLVDEVKDSDNSIYISERGEKQAVLISYKAFKNLYKSESQAQRVLTFAGIWQDKKEFKDSVGWVNYVREKSRRKF
ncbi:MAG: hypothetical protein Fur003_1900 [Candidatus Dojkabacteria bacterium]